MLRALFDEVDRTILSEHRPTHVVLVDSAADLRRLCGQSHNLRAFIPRAQPTSQITFLAVGGDQQASQICYTTSNCRASLINHMVASLLGHSRFLVAEIVPYLHNLQINS